MSQTVFRAAYWTDHQGGEIVLTLPEQSHLSDSKLLAEARAEAESACLDLNRGDIVIGRWTE